MATPRIFAGMRSKSAHWNPLADYDTYTPVLSGATTNPNLGSTGEAQGYWWRNGRMIHGFARFLFSGSGVSAGTGVYEISLPFPADTSLNRIDASTSGEPTYVGSGRTQDGSASANSVMVATRLVTADQIRMNFNGAVGSVGSSTPFTWAAGDRISVNFRYLADPTTLPDPPRNSRTWRDGDLLPGPQSWRLDRIRRYTPRMLGSATDPNLGNDGSAIGWWRINGFWVTGEARFLFAGADLDPGGANYRFSLPVLIDESVEPDIANTAAGNFCIAEGFVRDDSTESNSGLLTGQIYNSDRGGFTRYQLVALLPDNGIGSVNLTWADGDRISFRFFYPADPEVIRREFT